MEQHVLRSQMRPAPASYEWLFDLLVGRTSAVAWAAAGELPATFERVEQFAVLPARPGSCSALTSYNALRSPRRRLARSMVALGLRAGLAQPLAGTRIDVGVAVGSTQEQRQHALLSEYLRALFGRGRLVVAFGAGSGPYRKPVLQVFALDGTPLGYVKVGWNDWTREAVRREAAALRACAARQMRLGVPAVLHQCAWRGLDLLVTAPLPAAVRRLGRGWRSPDAGLLREISELSPHHVGKLATSPWWLGLRARIQVGVADPGTRSALTVMTDSLERRHGGVTLEFGTWHGDLVPWNLARLGTRMYAWDWESSAPDAPLGFDAVHFHFQVAFVARRWPLEAAVAHAERSAGPALGA